MCTFLRTPEVFSGTYGLSKKASNAPWGFLIKLFLPVAITGVKVSHVKAKSGVLLRRSGSSNVTFYINKPCNFVFWREPDNLRLNVAVIVIGRS